MAIQLVPNDTNQPDIASAFSTLNQHLGTIPNLARVQAHSPAALKAWMGLNATTQSGSLPARLREQIALAIAEANQCHYCLAAHTLLGGKAGLSEDAFFVRALAPLAIPMKIPSDSCPSDQ